MNRVETLPITQIRPRQDQPRQYFEPEGIAQLADSIRSQGFIGQVTVRRVNGYYELLAGHRRRLAAMKAGLRELPAVIVDLDDRAAREFVLLDNLNREDILPWELGAGFAELIAKHGLSAEAVGQKAGRSVAFVKGRIDLSENAGEKLREAYISGQVGLAALQELAKLPCENLSPVRCPRCHKINREGLRECEACGYDLPEAWVVGNPQEEATHAARGRQLAAIQQIIEKVKGGYGLGEEPVQTSLGFDDLQLSEEVVRAKSQFEHKLSYIGKVDNWVTQNIDKLTQLTSNQLQAIEQQAQVIQAIGRRIATAVQQEQGRR